MLHGTCACVLMSRVHTRDSQRARPSRVGTSARALAHCAHPTLTPGTWSRPPQDRVSLVLHARPGRRTLTNLGRTEPNIKPIKPNLSRLRMRPSQPNVCVFELKPNLVECTPSDELCCAVTFGSLFKRQCIDATRPGRPPCEPTHTCGSWHE